MSNPVILTGLRANSQLTIGNYFGGMKRIVEHAKNHADDYQLNMFIPDLHSFTTPVDHRSLYDNILDNARHYVAAGLPVKHENVFLYRQSFIPAHSELTWILDCFTGFGQMKRMTQFKDKSSSESDVSLGLFNYPVLMAADILLYGARYVPVGDDQTQHLEFARDIAMRMNARFGEIFTVPEPVSAQHEFFGDTKGLRIMDLVDPTKKMSKSDETGKGVIFLSDTPQTAAQKIMSATTDALATVTYSPVEQPGVSNLLEILSLVRNEPLDSTIKSCAGMTRYGDFKAIVASEMGEFLERFQANLAAVDMEQVEKSLTESEALLNVQANATLLRVQQAVGLRR